MRAIKVAPSIGCVNSIQRLNGRLLKRNARCCAAPHENGVPEFPKPERTSKDERGSMGDGYNEFGLMTAR